MGSIRSIFLGSILGFSATGQDLWRMNPITLSFSGDIRQYERAFRIDYFKQSIIPSRVALVLSLLLFGVFAFLDAIMLPELKAFFWFIRFGIVSPLLIGVIIFSFSPAFKRIMQPLLAVTMYLGGLSIIVMTIFESKLGANYTYYVGLLLIFSMGYTFCRLRFIYATIAGWAIVVSYEVAAIWIAHTPFEILISNNFFFISANVIGMVVCYFIEKSVRRNFYMQVLLEKEQKKVQNANNALEKRVRARTGQLSKANKNLEKEIEIRKRHEEEKAQLEGQLIQLQKMETIGTLAGGIAHDFNNILTPILGYTEMVLEELPDASPLRSDVEQISGAATRAKDLVQQILTFSRQVEIEKKAIRMDHVVVEVLKLISASLPSNIEIRQELDEDCGTVLADSTQMHQILMNLCANAHHAMMEKGGILTVRLDKEQVGARRLNGSPKMIKGPYIRLIVTDTGHGMDKHTMERIFEPFFTRKEVGSGSGLGLSVVHGIVNSYNGTIIVQSEPGEGSTFIIYLPQHSEYLDHERTRQSENIKSSG